MVARLLLKPGRSYEEAVSKFEPYKEIQEINEEARRAADEFLERAFRLSKRGYIYINNRLEGFAPARSQIRADPLSRHPPDPRTHFGTTS